MATRLERFITQNDMKPAQIAREAGISRAYLLRVRKGHADPTRAVMVRIAAACSYLLRRKIEVRQLFNLTVRWR
jgi:transcriptional regulator with XRE-family HTH domain